MKKILLIGENDNKNSTTIEIKTSFNKLNFQVDTFNFRSVSYNYSYIKNFNRFFDFIYKFLNKFGFNYFYYNLLGRKEMRKDLLKKNFSQYAFVIFTKCEFIDPKAFLEIKKYTKVLFLF